jgi:hypothetical protein
MTLQGGAWRRDKIEVYVAISQLPVLSRVINGRKYKHTRRTNMNDVRFKR